MHSHALKTCVLVCLLCLWWPCVAASGEANDGPMAAPASERAVRMAIINLFQVTLSQAYSFKGEGKLPDFSTLDELFPAWDDNHPGAARRVWVDGRYLFYKVEFRADSVFVTSDFTATVRGKRIARWERKVSFLWWFNRTESGESYDIFEGRVLRNPKGQWVVQSIKVL